MADSVVLPASPIPVLVGVAGAGGVAVAAVLSPWLAVMVCAAALGGFLVSGST